MTADVRGSRMGGKLGGRLRDGDMNDDWLLGLSKLPVSALASSPAVAQ